MMSLGVGGGGEAWVSCIAGRALDIFRRKYPDRKIPPRVEQACVDAFYELMVKELHAVDAKELRVSAERVHYGRDERCPEPEDPDWWHINVRAEDIRWAFVEGYKYPLEEVSRQITDLQRVGDSSNRKVVVTGGSAWPRLLKDFVTAKCREANLDDPTFVIISDKSSIQNK
jgi:hypothetical protein